MADMAGGDMYLYEKNRQVELYEDEDKITNAGEFYIDDFLSEFRGTLQSKEYNNISVIQQRMTEQTESECGAEMQLTAGNNKEQFREVLEKVKRHLDGEFEKLSDAEKTRETEVQKKAIIGEYSYVKLYKEKIKSALGRLNLLYADYPEYYRDIGDAVFSELYGFAGLTPWVNDYTEEYRASSSLKVIGDEIYCLIDGKSVKQPQSITLERREQLRRNLLMSYPKERLEAGHNEVYMLREDGKHIRATLMSGDFTYPGQDVLVFRKYLLSEPENLTFERLASYGTFPHECCEMFRLLVELGPNIFFCGEVRSGKSTFLQVWQRYEDPTLEGTTVSSDEETNYADITDGPLIQIIADENRLEQAEKSLKRLDSNYIILSEVRSAAEYKFFLGITNMGTRRCKCTIHDNSAINFPYKMATEIVTKYGGDQNATISQLYSNIDYVFELYEVPTDRAKKKLKGIVELRYDPIEDVCSAHRICKYDAEKDSWKWKCDIGKDKAALAMGKEKEFLRFTEMLKKLEEANPILEDNVICPSYYKGNVLYSRKHL